MRAFEPTAAWLKEAAAEVREAGGKWSVGLTADMLERLAAAITAGAVEPTKGGADGA